MVKCTSCGKTIDKIPDWMQAVTVEFVCNNCPNRHTKNIAFINLEPEAPIASKMVDDEPDIEEIADEAEPEEA
jgi:hypothetical protein